MINCYELKKEMYLVPFINNVFKVGVWLFKRLYFINYFLGSGSAKDDHIIHKIMSSNWWNILNRGNIDMAGNITDIGQQMHNCIVILSLN